MVPCNDSKRLYYRYEQEFDAAAINTLKSGWYVLGESVNEFERLFSLIINSRFCIGVDNGTNAIKIGIQALGIGAGDEVIVQANTYIATVLGITANNAKPVFVEPNVFFNINVDLIEKSITKKTKAIIVTHLYGQAARMDKIVNLCKKHKLLLLEDCAQAHFAKFQDKQVGTFGDLGFFSFYPTKNIGAFGDAGAVVTNNEDLANKIRMLRNYGSCERYNFELENGTNSRLDEIQASLLNVKLRHYKEITNEKMSIATEYLNKIRNPLVQLPKIDECCTSVWHLFVLVVDNQEKFINHMLKNGIMVDVHYPIPPHLSKCYLNLGYKVGDFPLTEFLCKHIVDLPIFNGMTDDEIIQVIEAVNSYGK